MVRTIIQLSDELARQLHEQARRQGISKSELIRRSLARSLAEGAVPDQQELRRRAHRPVGNYTGPTEDVSEHHDRYLAEAYGK